MAPAAKNFYGAYILQAPAILVVSVVLLCQIHAESLVKLGLATVIMLTLT